MRAAIALLVGAVIVLWPRLEQRWTEEQWARGFLWEALRPSGSSGELAPPPPGLAHAPVWLARRALRAGDPPQALALARPAAAAGDVFALEVTGRALEAQGDFWGAVRAWEKAGASSRLRALAERAAAEKRFDVAAAAYEAAYAAFPQEGILIRATTLWQKAQNPPAAERLLRQALQEYPTASQRYAWLRLLADLLRAQRRWADVEAVYVWLLRERPGDVTVYIDLGWLRHLRGDGLDAALVEFKRAIAVAPERGEGYFAVGLCLTLTGRQAEAAPWFRQAEARHPDARWWYMVWGDRARQDNDLALAQTIFRSAIARYPEYAYAYYELAWTCRAANQPAEAVSAIERAVALAGPRADYYYYVRAGRIYEWAGDRARALAAYRAALAREPGNDEAAQGAARVAPGRPD